MLARASWCAVLLVGAWFVTSLHPFSIAATVAVVGCGVVAIVVGLDRYRRRPDRVTRASGMTVWVALASVLVAFELAQFAQHPRAAHPTLSSIVDTLLDAHVARTIAFAVWLVAAAALAAG